MVGVYLIKRGDNGLCYVGSSVDIEKRFKRHKEDLRAGKHHSIKLQRAWDKYGSKVFIFRIIEEIWNRRILRKRELFYIETMRPFYNTEVIDNSIMAHSEATKEKMSKSQLEYWDRRRKEGKMGISEAHKEAISRSHIGIRPDKETREKMRKARLGVIPWNKGLKGVQVGWNKGKHWSVEVREKMREAHLGRR